MKKTDLITITSVAVGTAALTLVTFWSGPLGAGAEGNALPPKIEKPSLKSHGIEFTVTTSEARVFKAGDQPLFELTALNTTDSPSTGSVCVTMTASLAADALSRVVRLPAVLWQQDQIVSLGPKERKTFTLPARTNLPPRGIIFVALRDSASPGALPVMPKTSVVALSFSTGGVAVPGLAKVAPAFEDPLVPQVLTAGTVPEPTAVVTFNPTIHQSGSNR